MWIEDKAWAGGKCFWGKGFRKMLGSWGGGLFVVVLMLVEADWLQLPGSVQALRSSCSTRVPLPGAMAGAKRVHEVHWPATRPCDRY